MGMKYRVIDGLFLDVSESWNFRRFIESEMQSSPKRFTARLNYNSRIFESDFYTILSMQYQRDSGISENRISFTGEELMAAEGELRYIPGNNFEVYVRGRFSEIDGVEDGTLDRQETSVFAGATYLFDTGIRFEFLGRIRGRVFRDADGDGHFTPGTDVPYHHVLVKLGAKKAYTDLDGVFLFDHVTPENQKIELDMSRFPKGSVLTTPNPQEVIVRQMQTSEILFGVTTRTLLSGFIFNDLDGDHIYTEKIDEGLGNVRVFLTGIHDAISNRVGFYTVKNLIPGSYTIKIDGKTFPGGILPSFPKGIDIEIKEGGAYRQNIPMYALRAIMGNVFIDADGNGQKDPGEPGAEGILIECQGNTVSTDKEGAFIFRNLRSGDAVVRVVEGSIPANLSFKGPAEKVLTLPKEATTERGMDFPLMKR